MNNWYSIFYWLTVADNAKSFFITFITIFTAVSVISTICYLYHGTADDGTESGQKVSRKWMFWSYPFMIFFWALFVFTPSKKDALLIVAGGGTMQYLTTDSTARQIPKELTNFVVTQLKSMSEEAKVEYGIQSQKDKILEEASKMTKNELLDRMKLDSNFANIIMGK